MISRLRRESALAALIAGSALLTVACQKVPLLAPSGSTITLTALATALPTNGSTDVIAQVIEAGGTPPHSGTLITFTTNLGTVQPSEAETDISGRVTVKYVAGTGSGTATIVAISGGVSASGTNAIKIAIGAAAVGKVAIDANPSIIPATGGTSTITATAFDVNGNQIGGVPMSFTTDAGAVLPAVANTDGNGRAQTTLTTTKQSTVTVTAGLSSSSGTGTGTTTTSAQTATVKVNVNVAPSVAIGAASPAAPAVGQSVTFPLTYVTDANGSPIQRVTVDFGDGRQEVLAGKPGSVSHIYGSSGSYTVRATVIDALGDTSSSSASLLVSAKLQPAVSISTTTPNPTAGSDITFTASVTPASGSGTNIASVSVDFGDPANPNNTANLGPVSGSGIVVHHVYPNSGTYTVVLTATDTNGGVGTATTSLFVQPATPLTVLLSATPTPAGVNTTESFTATVIGLGNSVVVNYHWVFNGPNPAADTSSNQQTRTYVAGSGPFTVTVTITTSTNLTATGSTIITP